MIIRILLIVLAVELIGLGYFAARRIASPRPVLPDIAASDPVLADDLRLLAEQAETGSIDAWMELGQALLGHGFYAHAKVCFGHILERAPDNRQAHAALAFCLQRVGQTGASTERYRQILADWTPRTPQQAEEYARYLYTIGTNYLREENADRAEKAFRENLPLIPARYQLAKLLVRSGRAAEALPIIEGVLQERPESLKFRDLQYRAFLDLKRDSEAAIAAEKLERSRQVVPLNLGMEYIEQYRSKYGMDRLVQEFNRVVASNDFDAMARKLEDLIERSGGLTSPDARLFQYRLLEVDLNRREPDRMLKVISELKNTGERSAELLRYQGEAQALNGLWGQAGESWRQAAQLAPHDEEIQRRLADFYEEQSDTAQRDQHVASAFRIRAARQYRANQIAEASKSIEESLSLNPDDLLAQTYRDRISRASTAP